MKTKKNELEEIAGFWDGETCEYCHGIIIERRVELYRHRGKDRFLFENVPAGVCSSCGAHYFSAHVLKMLDRIKQKHERTAERVAIPLMQFT